jgi:hypothetical protein
MRQMLHVALLACSAAAFSVVAAVTMADCLCVQLSC